MKVNNIIIALLLVMFPMMVTAQKLVGNAPDHVAVGEQFRLTYTVNTQNVSGFRAGKIPEGLEVLMGPSTSSQSSFQMVNGHTSSTSSITYTYIVSATKNGSYTIPPAKITADGKEITSNTLNIKVSGTPSTNNNQGGRQRPQQMRAAGSPISGSDLFIKVSANKHRVHEQEPVLLTYKVYTLVDLTQLEGKMPDLKGFHTQEIPLPQQKSFKVETVNGRPYRTVTWSQYVMFPQQTGKLKIPSITFNGMVVQQNRNIDPFEAFFNGGSGYVEVKKAIQAPGIEIQVDPLPTRPAGFSGAVGTFSLSAQLDKTQTKANDPVTLRVVVSGAGNMKLMKEPVVDIPKDFDKYDAKITDKTKISINGVEGNIIYDYLIVPRHQGKFEIPPVTMTYYDVSQNKYQTLKTESFVLDVAKGSGSSKMSNYTGQEDVQALNKDIRHIHLGNSRQHAIGDFFFGSVAYWVTLAVLSLIFLSLFIIFRQRAIDHANVGKMRGKKANKVATKRLKIARRLMQDNRPSEFYDEVLRALWGYVGDKLNIPVEQLSHDNINQRLSERQVDESTITLFMGALDECEFERYAPGDPKGNMNKVFEKAMTAIEKIEESYKSYKSGKTTRLAIVFLLLMLPVQFSSKSLGLISSTSFLEYLYMENRYTVLLSIPKSIECTFYISYELTHAEVEPVSRYVCRHQAVERRRLLVNGVSVLVEHDPVYACVHYEHVCTVVASERAGDNCGPELLTAVLGILPVNLPVSGIVVQQQVLISGAHPCLHAAWNAQVGCAVDISRLAEHVAALILVLAAVYGHLYGRLGAHVFVSYLPGSLNRIVQGLVALACPFVI